MTVERDWINLNAKPSMRELATAIAERRGYSLAALRSLDRDHKVCAVRAEAMAAIYATGHFSYPQIGRYFGGRDHTTVLYAVRRGRGESAMSARLPLGLAHQEAA